MFSAEDFPVSRTPLLADVAALKTSATCGPRSPDSFASFDPDGSWRKTCQGYSQVTLDGSLERFSETWPRAGMTRNGTAYQRQPSAPLTDAIESGSWPTPDANCGERFGTLKRGRRTNGTKRQISINDAARMWPTPRAEHDSGRHRGRPDTLHSAVKMWPTPGAADTRQRGHASSGATLRRLAAGKQIALSQAVSNTTGALNPTWVEWLMGYPLGWTVCEGWETRSSRRSRNGSRGKSSTRKKG
jgi:hypothetical protein